jgi:hypothetical protein
VIPEGTYMIQIGSSSREIHLQTEVTVNGTSLSNKKLPQWYLHPDNGYVSKADFEGLLGHPVPLDKAPKRGEYTMACSMKDMQESLIMKIVIHSIEKMIAKGYGGKIDYKNPNLRMEVESSVGAPIKKMILLSGGKMPANVAQGLVELANRRIFKSLKSFLSGVSQPDPTKINHQE